MPSCRGNVVELHRLQRPLICNGARMIACAIDAENFMELPNKDLGTLFEQLGLDSDPASIDAFIAQHAPLPNEVKVSEAPFWNESQAAFLKSELLEDAEWAPIVDELNVRLHEHNAP